MKMFVVHYRTNWEDNFFVNEYEVLFYNDVDQARQAFHEEFGKYGAFLVAIYEPKLVWKEPLETLAEGIDGYDDDCFGEVKP